jgi:hypothetical protein
MHTEERYDAGGLREESKLKNKEVKRESNCLAQSVMI